MLPRQPAGVLNVSDTLGAGAFPYTGPMSRALPPLSNATSQLWLPRLSLAGCMRGVMARDTRAAQLPPEQRFNHYPATPMCTISWWFAGAVDMLAPGAPASLDSQRSPIPWPVAFSGPFTRPSITWNRGPGHGMMLLLLPDAIHHLTGIDPGRWVNRIADAAEALPADWLQMCRAVAAGADDDHRVQIIQDFLEPRWRAARPMGGLGVQRYADWATGLALRAATSRTGRSLRQVERRIRLLAGQPLRELKGLGRAERAFFQALHAEDPHNPQWAGLAAQAGYSDQSHLCRQSRRITGHSPAELWQRIAHDEGFWAYRIWQ